MKRRSPWTAPSLIVAAVVVATAVGLRWYGGRLGQAFSAGQRLAIPATGAAPTPAMDAPPTAANTPASAGSVTTRADISVDPRRQQLIGVRTVTAKRVDLAATIRTLGIVRYDETRQVDVNVKVEGWITDLFVDFTGQLVRKGQPLFSLYSPDLLNTEHEYLLALKTRDQIQQSTIADARQRAGDLVAAARQRLVLWDLTPEYIATLEENRTPDPSVTFRSPAEGFVIEKQALKGAHIMAGQTLYKIADLSVVWVEADVYESEIPLVKVGGRAIVTLDAYPGERFPGRVLYIYPYVDEKTRTNKVRYQFANRSGRLKPGMFANVEIATAAGVGVTIPTDALLDSGKEQIVFVDQGNGYFQPRGVKVGRRLGNDVQILEGVQDGEVVATGATFFLDSESQLRASLQGFQPAPPGAAAYTPSQQLDITLRSQPDPPRSGENQFEAVVKDLSGRPIDDADVSVQFFMPAMPTMNMPAMRNEVRLSPAGAGVYRGTGQVMMAGRWETTVTVTRGGQRLGTKQLPLVAR